MQSTPTPPAAPTINPADFATKAEFQAFRGELDDLKAQVIEFIAKRPATNTQKEVGDDV